MSTDHTIHQDCDKEVVITKRSARFDLDLYGWGSHEGDCPGPQQMSADEALDMATLIIYAVWCSYPDKADALAQALAKDVCDAAMAAQERKGHE